MSVQRAVIFQAIPQISHERKLKYLVDNFFSKKENGVEIESKEVSMVKRVLQNEFQRFRFKKGAWQIEYSEKQQRVVYKFKEKPTEDYLLRLQEKSKKEWAKDCLVMLKQHAANIKAGAPPVLPLLGVLSPEPKCKHCGGKEWIMNQRFACAKCGMEGHAIHPTGFDHRNMRREDGHDPSQNNGFVHNSDLSEAANLATMVRRAPANARGSGNPIGQRPFEGIQRANRKLNPQTKTDNQLICAKEKIFGFCSDYQEPLSTARDAYKMFKAFVNNNDKLPSKSQTIAACILNCLRPPHASSAFSAGASSASSASASSAGASGASSAGASSASSASAGASRKRSRCETPEYLLLKEMTEKFQAEETEKKKRRNSL